MDFYRAAERRIWRFQLVLGALGIAGAWWLAGAGGAGGFAAGAAVSTLNFRWLQQAVDAVAERAAEARPAGAVRRKRRLLVVKFLGRYLLIGAAGYGILKHTVWNVKALLAGLFLFVAAILAEICVEIVWGLTGEQDGT